MTGGGGGGRYIRWAGGHLERLHRVSQESTIFDVVSMVSRQDVTRITVPNTLTLSIADRLAMGTECWQNDLLQLD